VLHDFPAGARAGQLVHEVLELMDFQASDSAALHSAVTESLARFGFEEKWAEPLCRAIGDILATPLGAGAPPLALRDVPQSKRLSELEFLFPVAGGAAVEPSAVEKPDRDGVLLTRARLAAVFERYRTAPLPAGYASRIRALEFAPLAGFLRGFIDLVFEHDGRWYVVDYKSNLLGAHPEDYRPSQLVDAMVEHHYFLQYHLYVVALHRYLMKRLAGYDYEQHFGGVYYMFLRGMAPQFERGNGVFHDRPSRRLIEGLSAVLAGRAEAA